jgi:hypothetical protein
VAEQNPQVVARFETFFKTARTADPKWPIKKPAKPADAPAKPASPGKL